MSVNTEQIMAEIKKNAASREYPKEVLQFSEIQVQPVDKYDSFDGQRLRDDIDEMNARYLVTAAMPPHGNIFVRFLQKIFGRVMRGMINSVVQQQNVFNGAACRTVNEFSQYNLGGRLRDIHQVMDVLEEDADLTRQELEEMDKTHRAYVKEHEAIEADMQARIDQLEARLAKMEQALEGKEAKA